MTDHDLADLGWSAAFRDPDGAEDDGIPMRVAEVHRDRVRVFGPGEADMLALAPGTGAGDIAVGDWVLADPGTGRVGRVLPRRSAIRRRAAGTDVREQLIAANVDTMMIVTSCNADFNEGRLERYVALAEASGVLPLVVLTKADLTGDADSYRRRAERVSPVLSAVALDARDPGVVEDALGPWLRPGETAVLVGSSGVGKSTLMNTLTGAEAATAPIREDDAKGRHTTTVRSLRRARTGGWIIDTPGMRSLRLAGVSDGIEAVFGDISRLAEGCRFRDCRHETEPGCAVRAAIEDGRLDPKRLERWRKLGREDRYNTETIAEARARHRAFGRIVKTITRDDPKRR